MVHRDRWAEGFTSYRTNPRLRTLRRMASGDHPLGARRRAGCALVGLLQVGACAAALGWFATGHASAPDDGLLQLDLLTLSERVPGVEAVDGRPTLVVAAGRCERPPPSGSHLDARYRLVVSTDPQLARRLALHAAAERCQPGYVVVDPHGVVRYRSYDPGWRDHAFEQEVLLAHVDARHR